MFMKKRLLYVTHFPWNWAKQRPQFIAEQLAQYFDIQLFCHSARRKDVRSENFTSLKIRYLWHLPRYLSSGVLWDMNNFVYDLQLLRFVSTADIVFVTSPTCCSRFIAQASRRHLVYDCMDDILEFPIIKQNKAICDRVRRNERRLFEAARFVTCSSEWLRKKLIERYGGGCEKTYVVNNAIQIPVDGTAHQLENNKRQLLEDCRPSAVYIGTISSWFDFDTVIASLDRCSDLTYYLCGPPDTAIPRHERLIHLGMLTHSEVFSVMNYAKVLVMPFILTDLILSVNPVKLYEYIYSGKPVIAKRYPETECFDKYVYLYSSVEEYVSLVTEFCAGKLKPKRTVEECRAFCKRNSWEQRGKEIAGLINQTF